MSGIASGPASAAVHLQFRPSEAQVKAKTAFWSYFLSEASLYPPEDVDGAVAAKFASDRRVEQWWSTPEFREWFLNRDEFRQQVEFLASLALTELQQIITDESASSAARVTAIKLVMDLANKMPKKVEARELTPEEKLISEMSKEKLQEFIKTNTVKLIK